MHMSDCGYIDCCPAERLTARNRVLEAEQEMFERNASVIMNRKDRRIAKLEQRINAVRDIISDCEHTGSNESIEWMQGIKRVIK